MEQFLNEYDQKFADINSDKSQLYESLHSKVKHDSKNPELYWRLVQASLEVASSYEKDGNKSEGQKYTEESVKHAKKAVEYGPKSMQAHKW